MPKGVTKKCVDTSHKTATTKQRGDAAEQQALHHLLDQGLQLVQRNYRTPGRGGGEIDLIMQAPDSTVVFVEVRHRARATHGGALASVTWVKQRRIVFAARHFLQRLPSWPPCRFDVVALDGEQLTWFRGVFDAG
jgi:putative endonuclease